MAEQGLTGVFSKKIISLNLKAAFSQSFHMLFTSSSFNCLAKHEVRKSNKNIIVSYLKSAKEAAYSVFRNVELK